MSCFIVLNALGIFARKVLEYFYDILLKKTDKTGLLSRSNQISVLPLATCMQRVFASLCISVGKPITECLPFRKGYMKNTF